MVLSIPVDLVDDKMMENIGAEVSSSGKMQGASFSSFPQRWRENSDSMKPVLEYDLNDDRDFERMEGCSN